MGAAKPLSFLHATHRTKTHTANLNTWVAVCVGNEGGAQRGRRRPLLSHSTDGVCTRHTTELGPLNATGWSESLSAPLETHAGPALLCAGQDTRFPEHPRASVADGRARSASQHPPNTGRAGRAHRKSGSAVNGFWMTTRPTHHLGCRQPPLGRMPEMLFLPVSRGPWRREPAASQSGRPARGGSAAWVQPRAMATPCRAGAWVLGQEAWGVHVLCPVALWGAQT